MSVSNFASPSPRFTSSAPSGPTKVRSRMARIAGELAAELARPAAELDAGRLTLSGAQLQRRQAAARVLPLLDAERANLDALEAERADALASQHRAAAEAEARLPASALARATSTARLFDAGGAGDKVGRERFVQAVADGDLDAIHASLVLSPYGPLAAVAERGRAKFLASAVPANKIAELRSLTCTLGIVRAEFDALRAEVAALAKTGEEPRLTGAALLEKANDADQVALIEEGRRLGVIEAVDASTGSKSTAGADRVAAVVAGEASSVGRVATGGR